MTTDPLALLRTAETYLAATHEHAARHDNLGADYTCGGCQLRERIAAALAEASVTADPCHPCGCPRRFNRHADGCPIRDRIVEALLTTPNDGWTYKPGHEKWDHHKHSTRPGHDYGIYCALCKGNVDVLANAVLAALPDSWGTFELRGDTEIRAAALREAADIAARWVSDCQNCAVELEVARELRRRADEEQQS